MEMIEKIEKKLYGDKFEAVTLERCLRSAQPKEAALAVCFYGEAPNFFKKGGKVSAFEYLPVFCDQLREAGTQTVFASTKKGIAKFLAQAARTNTKTVIVCIYREVDFAPTDPALFELIDQADLVFNHPLSGIVVANKLRSHAALTKAGCALPQLAEDLPADAEVFSNEIESSGAEAFTTRNRDDLSKDRFNAQFIDTRMEYGGAHYHTTMRLMCINDTITHTFMRARDAAEGSANVHAINTPQDPGLINALWTETLAKYSGQFQDIAAKVYETYGSGFYSHDTLIDHKTQKAYICETGYKFNDMSYERRVSEFRGDVTGLKGFADPAQNATTTAPIFLGIVRRELGIA